MLTVHKLTFFVWLAFTAGHVLGHLTAMPGSLRAVRRSPAMQLGTESGRAGRWIAISGALVGGLILALVLIPDFAVWTQHGALAHHHRG